MYRGLLAILRYRPSDNTAGGSIDLGDDVDTIFLILQTCTTHPVRSPGMAHWGVGSIGEAVGIGGHPIGHGLMRDTEDTSDAAQIDAINIQLQRLLAQCFRVSLDDGFWGILAPTAFAEIPLASRRIMTDFYLALGLSTMRTSHPLILPHTLSFRHSRKRNIMDVWRTATSDCPCKFSR